MASGLSPLPNPAMCFGPFFLCRVEVRVNDNVESLSLFPSAISRPVGVGCDRAAMTLRLNLYPKVRTNEENI